RGFCFRVNEVVCPEGRRYELDVLLEIWERLRLEEELLKALPLDRISLANGDDTLREEASQVREPHGQLGRKIWIRPAEGRAPLFLAIDELHRRVQVEQGPAVKPPCGHAQGPAGNVHAQAAEAHTKRTHSVGAASQAQ